jgi:hypothetical protein
VLVLSEQPTRLYDGTRDILVEVQGNGFPMTHNLPGGSTELPGGAGVNPSAIRDERHRQFFRQVDSALGEFTKVDPLPLAVVGVDRLVSFFQEVSNHKDAIVATISGSHDKTSAYELGQLVWPQVKAGVAEQRQKVMRLLDSAVGAQKVASTIGEVWRFAQEGRGSVLLVEEDYHQPAKVDGSGFNLTLVDDPTPTDVLEDAVDDVIEVVLEKGGRVVFVDPGTLREHQRIALVLRY